MSDAIAITELTEVEANRLTQRIELKLESAANAWEGAIDLIREAYEKNAYIVLGYRSHGDYMQEKFSAALSRLSIEDRRESVQELSDMGLSVRAIGPIVGASKSQVSRDLLAPVPHGTPEPDATGTAPLEDDREVVEVISEPPSREVTGIDGKAYSAPAKKAPRRRPITDAAHSLRGDMFKLALRIKELVADDRLHANRGGLHDLLDGPMSKLEDALGDAHYQLVGGTEGLRTIQVSDTASSSTVDEEDSEGTEVTA